MTDWHGIPEDYRNKADIYLVKEFEMNTETQKEIEREITDQVGRLSITAAALSVVAQRLYDKVSPLLNESAQGESSGEIVEGKDDALCPLAGEIRRYNNSIEASKAKIDATINAIEL